MNSPRTQQLPLDFVTRPAMGREDFLIGSENKEAVGWIDAWPNWPAPALILGGPAACGKSHLAAVWCERTKAHNVHDDLLLNASAEEIIGDHDYLLLDGVDPWIGDVAIETTIFHLYNMIKESGRSMMITMRSSPTQLDFALKDLASRLRAAPLATIYPPGDDLLGSILIKQFYDRQLTVSTDVIQYILPRMERSFAAARDIVEYADKAALAQKRAVSVPLMRQVLADIQS